MKENFWEVVDHNGAVVFDSDFVAHTNAAVMSGALSPKEYADHLAKENSDPDAPAPLRVRQVER